MVNKPTRADLQRNHPWIYSHLQKNKLLDKYCTERRKETNLNDAKREYKKIYGNKKIGRNQLLRNHKNIYYHFKKNNLLDKYCTVKKTGRRLKESIKEFKRIYDNEKPYRSILEKENMWIYGHFRKNNLLDKYCLPKVR